MGHLCFHLTTQEAQQEESSLIEDNNQTQQGSEGSSVHGQKELNEFHSDRDPPPPDKLDSVDGDVPNQIETTGEISVTHQDLD